MAQHFLLDNKNETCNTLNSIVYNKRYQVKHIFNITPLTSTKLVTNIHNEMNK